MSSQYPNGVDQFQIHSDNANEKISASAVNNLQDSVVAIQNSLGTNNNQSVRKEQALVQRIDTRSTSATYDANGRLATLPEKDGATVVRNTTFGYDANGRLSTITETVGAQTYVTTINYNPDGTYAGETRS